MKVRVNCVFITESEFQAIMQKLYIMWIASNKRLDGGDCCAVEETQRHSKHLSEIASAPSFEMMTGLHFHFHSNS